MSSTPFVAPTLETLAELLPAYDFESFIAQGGMGAVYKARQRALDRDVAIKILPRELGDDPAFRQSFETEAKAMARLNHPNLIGVYDSGDLDGLLYIVMEYVNGKSLYHSAYNMAVDPQQAALLVKGICDGLAHAHEHGVIHRDIKPANILLTPRAVPKIGDFGLARPSGFEGAGLNMGTLGYTAPEIHADPGYADQKTDIFAVGVILYELLTGHMPEENGLQPPSAVVGCDKKLDTIWRKATDPDPSRRYGRAVEMADDLENWARREPEPLTLRPASTSGPKVPQAATAATRVPAIRAAAPAAPRQGPLVLPSSRPDRTIPIIIAIILVIGAALIALKMHQQTESERIFKIKEEEAKVAAAKLEAEQKAAKEAAEAKPDPKSIRFAPGPATPEPEPAPATPEQGTPPAPTTPEKTPPP